MARNEPEPGELDDDLSAHFDGELSEEESPGVDARIAHDPAARDQLDAIRQIDGLLDHLPKVTPSADFTTRTLTRLHPVPSSASASSTQALPGASASGQSLHALPHSPLGGWFVGLWAVVVLLAGFGGYLAHAAFRPTISVDDNALSLEDLRIIENLPIYLGVDHLEFAKALEEMPFFETAMPAAPALSHTQMAVETRDKLTALFKSYPIARRHQIRQLDAELHELPAAQQTRLFAVLRQYAVWLDRLPDLERNEILSAPTAAERLEAVRRVWEKAWRDGLPLRSREQLEQTSDAEKRLQRIEEWKAGERSRRDEWQLARRQWAEVIRSTSDRRPWPFKDPALAADVEEYITRVLNADLTPKGKTEPAHFGRLSRDEYTELRSRRDEAMKEGHWFSYGLLLYRLEVMHPSSPGPRKGPPITDVNHLPTAYREIKPRSVMNMASKRASRGKWPEFALDVHEALKRLGIPAPAPLGPTKPSELTTDVQTFVERTLIPKLSKTEQQELTATEGAWPEYPNRMMSLARKYDLPVPGVTLPGKPSEWEKYYSLRPRTRR